MMTHNPTHTQQQSPTNPRYLPQGENIQAVHRFLWQVQYLVSQGFYVAITHTSYLTRDPNMVDPNMLASNWGNLWRMISELPGYDKYLKGRVFPGVLVLRCWLFVVCCLCRRLVKLHVGLVGC